MSSTTIHWGRILLGGLLAEVALILAIVPLRLRLGVGHRLRRNPFTIDSLPHRFRLALYENSPSAGLAQLRRGARLR
jgi:hypothetical protein